MKKAALLFVVLVVFFSACKEEDDKNGENKFDTINVSASQEAYVLLTTATWCQYCADWGVPTFEAAFAGEDGIDATKINGFALHYSSSDPFNNSIAETMKTTLGIGGPPNLWLDFDHTYKLNPAGWKTAVKARQNSPDADCGVGLLVERDGNSVNVYAKVRFFNQLSGNYNLAVYVVESGMIASQSTPSGTDPNYEHNLVLRDEIANGSAWGMPLFTGSSVDEYQVTIEYMPGPGIDLDNVKYVAVIYEMDATGKPVSSPNSNTK